MTTKDINSVNVISNLGRTFTIGLVSPHIILSSTLQCCHVHVIKKDLSRLQNDCWFSKFFNIVYLSYLSLKNFDIPKTENSSLESRKCQNILLRFLVYSDNR